MRKKQTLVKKERNARIRFKIDDLLKDGYERTTQQIQETICFSEKIKPSRNIIGSILGHGTYKRRFVWRKGSKVFYWEKAEVDLIA